MAHVELSLSPLTDAGRNRGAGMHDAAVHEVGVDDSLNRWAQVVALAPEPSMLLNDEGIVVAVSPGCAATLGIDTFRAVGRRLVGEVLRLLDFSANSGELPPWETEKIPPMIAVSSGTLARGLLRFDTIDGPRTVDAVSVPLLDGRHTWPAVGSLTFFAAVRAA